MLLFATAVGVVLVVSFLCSIFESVLLSLTRPQIEVLTRSGRRSGTLLAGFKENIDSPISAILILNTAAHTIGASVAGASYAELFSSGSLWLFSILFTIAVLLFTEIIPKTLGVTYATRLAPSVAHGIDWLTRGLRPLVALSRTVSRAFRGSGNTPVTSAEEIRILAFLGGSEGVFGVKTAGMIVGATQLRYLQAHDIMVPRDEVTILSGAMSPEEAMNLVRDTGHSRFPFSPEGRIDDISGVVLAKELLYKVLQAGSHSIDWAALSRQPLIVPRSSPLPQLLKNFQESRRHLAIVVDEFGGVEGIVTLEDVLEEIVGEIRDESDAPTRDIVEERDGSLTVKAGIDLRRLSARLGIIWEPSGGVSTIGGLVSEVLEHIPTVGDFIVWKGYRVEVKRAGPQGVKLLSIQPMGKTPEN